VVPGETPFTARIRRPNRDLGPSTRDDPQPDWCPRPGAR